MTTSQEFGGTHTETKLSAIRDYLPAYTTALKNKSFRLHYVDAFAGTGFCKIQTPSGRITIPGSASIATECTPPFDSITFIEGKKRKCEALTRLAEGKPSLSIKVLNGDANYFVPQRINELNAWNDRNIVFLDPFGMGVNWETLEAISVSKNTDVWYLFSLSGLYRQAAIDPNQISDDKRDAITRCLGTDEWRNAFYGKPTLPLPSIHDDLFGEELIEAHEQISSLITEQRLSSPDEMLKWVTQRLKTVFPYVHPPEILYQGQNRIPVFALFFMMSNDSVRAIGLAKRLVTRIFKKVREEAELDKQPIPAL